MGWSDAKAGLEARLGELMELEDVGASEVGAALRLSLIHI